MTNAMHSETSSTSPKTTKKATTKSRTPKIGTIIKVKIILNIICKRNWLAIIQIKLTFSRSICKQSWTHVILASSILVFRQRLGNILMEKEESETLTISLSATKLNKNSKKMQITRLETKDKAKETWIRTNRISLSYHRMMPILLEAIKLLNTIKWKVARSNETNNYLLYSNSNQVIIARAAIHEA